jgi:TrmH family RNA methyltransferase
MGNEGKGVCHEIELLVSDKLYIPNYPIGRSTTESLNVAMATAITCAEFSRRG